MKELVIPVLLIVGLNLPVYLELYKHVLRHQAKWISITVSIVFWSAAGLTQTIAAFAAVIYMYFAVYRRIEIDESMRETDTWHISFSDVIKSTLVTLAGRFFISIANVIFVIVLSQLTELELKPQAIVEYYTQVPLFAKLLLALEIVIIAPIVEEYVFRYFLYDKVFMPRMPKSMAALFSAVLFTVLHFNITGVPTFLLLGLLCTFIYNKKGYFGAVTVHAVSNLITLLLL